MKRLTERDEFGNADIIALSEMMPEIYAELSFFETNALTAALNRLAAYEDTGLTPEEINRQKAKIEALQMDNKQLQSDIINANQNNDHIKELWEDEKEKVAKAKQKVINICKELQTAKAEIERMDKIQIEIDNFARSICNERMSNGKVISDFQDLQQYIRKEKAEAIKEFAERLKGE